MRLNTLILLTMSTLLGVPAARADIAPPPGEIETPVAHYFTGLDAVPDGLIFAQISIPGTPNTDKIGMVQRLTRDSRKGFRGPLMAPRRPSAGIRLIALTEAQLLEAMKLADQWLPPRTPRHPKWTPTPDAKLLAKRQYFNVDLSRPGNHKLRQFLLGNDIITSPALQTTTHAKPGTQASTYWRITGVANNRLMLDKTDADSGDKPKPAPAADDTPKPAPAADDKPKPAADDTPKPAPAADDKPKPAADDKPKPAADDTPKPAPAADDTPATQKSTGCHGAPTPAPVWLALGLLGWLVTRRRRTSA